MEIRYKSRNPAIRWPLIACDFVLNAAFRLRKKPSTLDPGRIRRILICNQAHLGDAILASSIVPIIRNHYPDAEIGFLVHPLAVEVFRDNPDVKWIHTVEHWYLNRRRESSLAKGLRYIQTRRRAKREIKDLDYDLAIDAYHYFPNSIPLIWSTGIVNRIGWSSGGFSPLLTRFMHDPEDGLNILDRHAALCKLFCNGSIHNMRPALHVSAAVRASWLVKATRSHLAEKYVVLHIGAHDSHRRWPTSRWSDFARELVLRGWSVAVMGQGADEADTCRQICSAAPEVIDFSNQLEWDEFAAAVSGCEILVSHDSAATHLGAGFDRPRVCIAAGINDLKTWLKADCNCIILMQDVECAPCGRPYGCSTMKCIRGISTDQLLAAFDKLTADKKINKRPVIAISLEAPQIEGHES